MAYRRTYAKESGCVMWLDILFLLAAIAGIIVGGDRFLALERWVERKDYQRHFED
jgi:hypothetical protein